MNDAPIDTSTIYIVGHITDGGNGSFDWNFDRDAVYEAYLDDVELVKEGLLQGARFSTYVLPLALKGARLDRITAWLDNSPDLWEPPIKETTT